MKLISCVLLATTLWSTPAKPAADIALSETLRASLTNGNARQLSAHFAKTLELIIDAENVEFQSVQATHAELILRSFFRKYPPHHFQFVYQGASDRMQYSTGIYQTDGRSFAVYVLMRQASDQQYIISALHFRKKG